MLSPARWPASRTRTVCVSGVQLGRGGRGWLGVRQRWELLDVSRGTGCPGQVARLWCPGGVSRAHGYLAGTASYLRQAACGLACRLRLPLTVLPMPRPRTARWRPLGVPQGRPC